MHRLTALALATLFVFQAQLAKAGILEGEVKGARGEPKSFVRVEISGLERRTIFTNESGRFKVELREGNYAVNIQERTRRQDFAASVRGSGTTSQNFKLGW